MKFEFLIAKRNLSSNKLRNDNQRHNFSKPIVNLATIGITLGVSIMILSSSIAIGFQSEIKNKVLGFSSHFQISEMFDNNSFESAPMEINQKWITDVTNDPLFNSLQKMAFKPGIIQSRTVSDTTSQGTEIRDLTGIIFKGVGNDYNNTFIKNALKSGTFPHFETSHFTPNDSICISSHTANQLLLKVNDKVACFFVSQDGPQQRILTVAGIYETGLEDFDKQFSFVDITLIQSINKWGIQAFLELKDQCYFGLPVIEAKAFGGNGNYRYQWDNGGFQEINKTPLCPLRDTIISVIITDVDTYSYLDQPQPKTISDTAWLRIHVVGNEDCLCEEKNSTLKTHYLNDSVTEYYFKNSKITTTLYTSGGSNKYYCGGYELSIAHFERLEEAKKTLQFYTENSLNIQSIIERHEELFKWLEMLDMNVYIILALMIVVAIINMVAALLVIILERTKMIGILKALGAKNWTIRKIFILQGAIIIFKGLFFGNLVAFTIIGLQNWLSIFTLPQANYYVSIVPMYFPVSQIIIINIISFLIASFALVLPTAIVTKINPIKAIQFE